jgi:DNA-nicking Smr family endonuclease
MRVVESLYGNTEVTLRLAEELHEFYPTIAKETIIQVLISTANDVSETSSRLQEIEDQQENEGTAPDEAPISSEEIAIRRKLDRQFPSVGMDVINQTILENGLDLQAIVLSLVPLHGLPVRGKYRNSFDRMLLMYPELGHTTLLSMMLEAKFSEAELHSALLNCPVKTTRVSRHVKKLMKKFPDLEEEQIRATLQAKLFDYNRTLLALEARKVNSASHRTHVLQRRLMELYGKEQAEVLEEIIQASEVDIFKAMHLCSEVFGPPGGVDTAQPDSTAEQTPDDDREATRDDEYDDIQERMEALSETIKELAVKAKDLTEAGLLAEAKSARRQAKQARKEHDVLYREVYEETFRRNNLRRDINSVDLHGLKLDEAMTVLERYLVVMQELVSSEGIPEHKVTVITGWGRHNISKKSVLKERAAEMMAARRLCFYELNKGSYEVVLRA